MQYVKYIIFAVILASQVVGVSVHAVQNYSSAAGDIVISQLQAGGIVTGTAGQEFVELFNRSDGDVDVTNWCISYSSASDATTSIVGCLTPPSPDTSLFIQPKGYVTIVSPDYLTSGNPVGDFTFNYIGGISATSGHVRVSDSVGDLVDTVGWGAAIQPEASPAPSIPPGKSLQRLTDGSDVHDTNNNSSDFTVGLPTRHASGLVEVVSIFDACTNIAQVQSTVPDGLIRDANGICAAPKILDACDDIEGVQSTIPDGYGVDATNVCGPDVCSNITGYQASVPIDMVASSPGLCTVVDVCPNIPLAQAVVPDRYIVNEAGACLQSFVPLQVAEVMPNPIGVDTGNEFIEFYNPSSDAADLSQYYITLGLTDQKRFEFPTGVTVSGGGRFVLYNSEVKFTLSNTASEVRLFTRDGQLVSGSGEYAAPKDGFSWSRFDDGWRYTNTPTPGDMNSLSSEADIQNKVVTAAITAVCSPGKYRNESTNRCRNVEGDSSSESTCKVGQFRSLDTHRCRKVAVLSASVVACKDTQFRSEETNRCRAIASTKEPAACKPGQERNAETNRCRAVAKSIPAAAYAVTPVADSGKAFIGWWALAVITVIALGYACWEWRREVTTLFKKRIFRKSQS